MPEIENSLYPVFGVYLTLCDYDAQVGEAMAVLRALDKLRWQACQKVRKLPD